jgi:hypothetical protein
MQFFPVCLNFFSFSQFFPKLPSFARLTQAHLPGALTPAFMDPAAVCLIWIFLARNLTFNKKYGIILKKGSF